MSNFEIAQMSNTYDEYCRQYNAFNSIKEDVHKPDPSRMITIRFNDGEIRNVHMVIFSVLDLIKFSQGGSEIIGYEYDEDLMYE